MVVKNVFLIFTRTVLELAASQSANMTAGASFLQAVGTFCMMFFGSAAIGVVTALISALISFYLKKCSPV